MHFLHLAVVRVMLCIKYHTFFSKEKLGAIGDIEPFLREAKVAEKFDITVKPLYDVPGCNGFPVTMSGSAGLVRSLIKMMY